MNFGTNLRNLRLQRNLTQQKLAKDMNMSHASITSYETGFREPSFEIIRRFAEYFNVAPSMLMPFGEVSDEEYVQRVAEALNKNPKLRALFDKAKVLSDTELDTVIAVAGAFSREGEK